MFLRFLKSVTGIKEVKSGPVCMHAAYGGQWFDTRCRECRIVAIRVCVDCFDAKAVSLLCNACEHELGLVAAEAYKKGGAALKDMPIFGSSQSMSAADGRDT